MHHSAHIQQQMGPQSNCSSSSEFDEMGEQPLQFLFSRFAFIPGVTLAQREPSPERRFRAVLVAIETDAKQHLETKDENDKLTSNVARIRARRNKLLDINQRLIHDAHRLRKERDRAEAKIVLPRISTPSGCPRRVSDTETSSRHSRPSTPRRDRCASRGSIRSPAWMDDWTVVAEGARVHTNMAWSQEERAAAQCEHDLRQQVRISAKTILTLSTQANESTAQIARLREELVQTKKGHAQDLMRYRDDLEKAQATISVKEKALRELNNKKEHDEGELRTMLAETDEGELRTMLAETDEHAKNYLQRLCDTDHELNKALQKIKCLETGSHSHGRRVERTLVASQKQVQEHENTIVFLKTSLKRAEEAQASGREKAEWDSKRVKKLEAELEEVKKERDTMRPYWDGMLERTQDLAALVE
ncbi:hypothetical protein BGZ74_007007 [Mortierella antarctica]|nr:hypothetical protein BGZ74_007007 [Mortierella antarctica]